MIIHSLVQTTGRNASKVNTRLPC